MGELREGGLGAISVNRRALSMGKGFRESGCGGGVWGGWAGPWHVPLAHAGCLLLTGWPRLAHSPPELAQPHGKQR